MVQLGYPGVDSSGWVGVAAPRGTPTAIIQKLYQELSAIGRLSDVRAKFEPSGYELVLSQPAKYGEFWILEDKKWGDLIRENNIKIDE